MIEREEGLLHLHTNTFLLFLCLLRLNLNRPTCPSSVFFNTSTSHSLHFYLSLVSFPCSLSPHLYPAHRAITTSHYHTIPVSLHLFHYLSVLLPLFTHYCVLCVYICVCVCVGITHPKVPFCTDIVDISSQFTGFLRLQCLTVFTSLQLTVLCMSRLYICLCVQGISGSIYMHFSI